MRFNHVCLVVAGVVSGLSGSLQAAFTYDFSTLPAGTVPTANQSPAPAGISYQGNTTIGSIGQDNWAWTSSTANFFPAISRNDTPSGMSGNYLSAYPTNPDTTTLSPQVIGTSPPYDSINTRKNNGTFGYTIPAAQPFSISFIATITGLKYNSSATVTSTTTSRAEIALGYDQNGDGDIRGDSSTSENAESGPIFGFEPAAAAGTAGLNGLWYLRGAAFASGTSIHTVAGAGPGTYLIQLDINPNANPNAGTANIYPGNDGSGTLSVQQLYDASGAPSVGAAGLLTPVMSNINLGLTAMNTHSGTNVGTVNGSNPAFWNGLLTRVSNNGAIDSIVITPEPTTLASIACAALLLAKRRRG